MGVVSWIDFSSFWTLAEHIADGLYARRWPRS